MNPILDQFISASKGKPDISFWTSINNLEGLSGNRSPITGWIQAFFPYLLKGNGSSSMIKNEYMNSYLKSIKNKTQNDLESGYDKGKGCGVGVKIDVIPGGISKVPFIYSDLNTGKNYDMFFCGGITCCVQDDDGTIEPRVGWAILEKTGEKQEE